jgi:hypothetical protein
MHIFLGISIIVNSFENGYNVDIDVGDEVVRVRWGIK